MTTDITFEGVLSRLKQLGCEPQPPNHRGQYQAKCPAHDDSTASLSVSRGNKRPVLLHCHAGCSYKSIINALGFEGKKRSREPQALPSGPNITRWIYRDIEGRNKLAVIRADDPDGKKRIWQMVPDYGKAWRMGGVSGKIPLLQVGKVADANRVVVVEGEKCVNVLEATFPKVVATTNAGGSKAWQKADWSVLAGKQVLLIADADEPGREMMRNVGALLAEFDGTTVSIVLPDGDSGDDIADWCADGTAADVIRTAVAYDADRHAPRDKPQSVGIDRGDGKLASNEHYTVLGILNSKIAVQIATGDLQTFTRNQIVSKGSLLAIAPRSFWVQVSYEPTLPGHAVESIGCALMAVADEKGILSDDDLHGYGPVVRDEQVIWHLGDRLLIGGDEKPFAEVDGVWLANKRVELAESATAAERARVRDAVLAYRWNTEDDGRRFLGWIVTGLVGGALSWRPHLLFTAIAGRGKSWILKHVVDPIHAPLGRRISNATAAAIARLARHESLPLIIDEAEANEGWMHELMALIRVAAGGDGIRIRCDGDRGFSTQAPRFSSLLSATTAANLRQADESRFTSIALGEEVADWTAVRNEIRDAMANGVARKLQAAIIRETADIVAAVDRVTEQLEHAGDTTTRDAKIVGALSAGWQWWGGSGTVGERELSPESQDALTLLDRILTTRLRILKSPSAPVEGTIAELLVDGPTVRKRLRFSHGVMLRDDGSLIIAHTHQGLRAELAKGANNYRDVDIGRLLMQLLPSGTAWCRVSIDNHTRVAVQLDRDTLRLHGYEFSEPRADDFDMLPHERELHDIVTGEGHRPDDGDTFYPDE